MAHYIMDDFQESNIMVLCVLKGGYKFCADLVEFIKVLGRNSGKYLETRVEFIRLKSYQVGSHANTYIWFDLSHVKRVELMGGGAICENSLNR